MDRYLYKNPWLAYLNILSDISTWFALAENLYYSMFLDSRTT